MAYVLESMLRIRAMREDRASEELVAARHAQEQAAANLSECKVRLQQWSDSKEERRNRVFDAIIGVPVKRTDIDLAKEAVARIDEEGVLLNDGVVRAKAELEEREKLSESAHRRYVVATRNHEKIVQHKSIWAEEERKIQEYAADAELEEFAGRRMFDDESDDFD